MPPPSTCGRARRRTTMFAGGPADGGHAPVFVRPPRHARRPPSCSSRRWSLSVAVPLGCAEPGELPVPTPSGPSAPAAGDDPRAGAAARAHAAPRRRGLGFIRERVAAGQLPNFAKLLDRGAAIDLATLKPTQATPVWAAAATGKYPPKNGMRSRIREPQPDDVDPVDLLPDYCFARRSSSGVRRAEDGCTSAALRARPFWQILATTAARPASSTGPLTSPAHAELGYIASDLR